MPDTNPTPPGSRYLAGQVWAYNTRTQDTGSILVVLRVDHDPTLGNIIHVQVQGLRLKSPHARSGFATTIGHMPLSEAALDKSVTTLLKEHVPVPAYEDGYRQWKENHGGVFSITVAEAIPGMEIALNQTSQPPLPH